MHNRFHETLCLVQFEGAGDVCHGHFSDLKRCSRVGAEELFEWWSYAAELRVHEDGVRDEAGGCGVVGLRGRGGWGEVVVREDSEVLRGFFLVNWM